MANGSDAAGARCLVQEGTAWGQMTLKILEVTGSAVVNTDALTWTLSHDLHATGGVELHDSDQIEDMSDLGAADLTAAIDFFVDNPWKHSVDLCTAAALAAYTRVDDVITANAVGALGNIDGVPTLAAMRILLKDGAAGADNGIYTVTTLGDGATAYVLTRVPELQAGDVAAGVVVHIEQGALYANHYGVCTDNAATAVVNTDALTFAVDNIVIASSATPQAIGTAAAGTALEVSRADHVHALPATISPIRLFKETVDHTDLAGGGITTPFALTGFPATARLVSAHVELDTEFSGGGVASCTVAIGDAGTADELFTATDVFTGAGAGLKVADGALLAGFQYEAAYAPLATFVVDGGHTCDDLTAGSLVVNIAYVEITLDTP